MKYCLTLLLLSAFAHNSQAQPGTIDKSYGMENTGTIAVTKTIYMQASATQKDDKLVVGGGTAIIGQYSLIRHKKDGSIDSTFGNGGQITISIDDMVKDMQSSDGWHSIAVAQDGKIATTGSVYYYNPDFKSSGLRLDNDIVIARFLPDGTPDESFGNHGRVVTNLGYLEYAYAIAVQPDGKLLVTGIQDKDIDGNGRSVILVRYNTNGTLDESFGGGKGFVKKGVEKPMQCSFNQTTK